MRRTIILSFLCAVSTFFSSCLIIKYSSPVLQIDGLLSLFWQGISQGSEHTRYSTNYSDTKFLSIHKNMTEKEVVLMLGKPLYIAYPCKDSNVYKLGFSDSPTSQDYRQRTVLINQGNVIKAKGGYYMD